MIKTDTVLDKIVAAKRDYLSAAKLRKSQIDLQHELETVVPFEGHGFYDTLKTAHLQPRLIAEVKKASPSAGVLRESFDLGYINEVYQAAEHVVAISIITEADYFKGSQDTLIFFAEHNTGRKPLLRKDFLFDPYQILESKLLGAQAYLLITSLFELDELQQLVGLGQSIGLEPLVEVHNQAELDIAQQTTARCVGVNARDLQTFSVDKDMHHLLSQLDTSYARVAESGITGPKDLRALEGLADAALIGSHFMQAPDVAMAIEALVDQSPVGETSS
jgi:indole-3-glycerol phosphate synthase